MATYYFRNTGTGAWGLSSNWSLTSGGGPTGSVPTANDIAVFDSNSISCFLTTINRFCLSLSCTTFTQTLDLVTFSLTVSGNIDLGSGMTLSSSGGALVVNTNSTLTTNTKSITAPFSAQTANTTLTFADNAIFASGLTIVGTLAQPITGRSSSSGVQRKVTINQGTSYSIDYCVAVDLDSGDGVTAWNYKGTQTNCVNWQNLPTSPPPVSNAL